MKNLRSSVRKIGNDIRRHFSADLERDPSRFKRRLLALLQAELPPRPGRPRLKQISVAVGMRDQGKSWRAVYATCVPKDLDDDSRQLAQTRLRAAIRARVRRRSVPR